MFVFSALGRVAHDGRVVGGRDDQEILPVDGDLGPGVLA
jgi:hypothetical protein